MRTLICGSFAFDTIMVFQDRFKNHILPDQVHILNVCFLAPEMRREYGGCAGNIAYNLNLLGGSPVAMGAVGSDFQDYRKWMAQCGIDDQHMVQVPDCFTAQAFITTDMDDNQITAFHPGAMNQAHINKVSDVDDIGLGIVAPDGKQAMIDHAEQFAELGIPFFFDPGQGLPMFNCDELKRFIELANYVIVNDYEHQLLQDHTELSSADIIDQVEALIVTCGASGSTIYSDGKAVDIPVVTVDKPADPTGCGDAYRGGLLHGLALGKDWETAGRIGSLISSLKVTTHGTQNHTIDAQAFAERFKKEFGYSYGQ